MKKIVLIFAVLTAGLFSCSKENSGNNNNSSNKRVAINFTELDLGEKHNEFVNSLLKNVDVNSENAVNQVYQNFYSIDIDLTPYNITRDSFNQITNSIMEEVFATGNDIANYSNHEIGQSAAYPFIVQLFEKIDEITVETNLEEFYNSLEPIIQNASNNLDGYDLELFIATKEIIKGSSKLWMPVDLGGEGKYEATFLPNSKEKVSQQVLNVIKKALMWDAVTLGVTFTKMGWMIAAGLEIPGANMAILVSVCIDAAVGSALGCFSF